MTPSDCEIFRTNSWNYSGRVAYKKLLALSVELVHSKLPALLRRYSPTTHPTHSLLRPCSLYSTIIRCCISILVPISRSCHVDFIKLRRRPRGGARNRLPWLQNWSLISRIKVMPSSMFWPYNILCTALNLPCSTFLVPAYRGLIVLLIVSQHALLASSKF